MPIKNETGTVVFFLISVKDISKSNAKMSFAREREGVKLNFFNFLIFWKILKYLEILFYFFF